MDLEILKQNNPAVAAFIEHWRQRYQRSFDFTQEEEKACFHEGVQEMARFIIENSKTGVLNVVPSVQGVNHMVVSI